MDPGTEPSRAHEADVELTIKGSWAESPLTLWVLAAVALLVFAIAGAFAVRGALRSSSEPEFRDPSPGAPAFVAALGEQDPDSRVHIAGSGSNLSLTRRLVDAYLEAHPVGRSGRPAQLVVFESIGSTGGVKATHDGVIDLGLISRPLRPRERELGLLTIPYARVAVVAAVNVTVPDRSLRTAELIEIYGGARRTWSDGSRIVVLQRERGDSSHEAFGRVHPAFTAANDEAYQRGLWRVVYRDSAMQEALMSTPRAIGLFDAGVVTSERLHSIELLAIDGVAPSPENMSNGSYPYFKDLAFISAGPPRGLAADFVDFVASPAGRAIIRANGYATLPEQGPEGAP
ncbi:MAG: substrate-binding domain-containing protein [Myxococcales bacterium]|nr:substrate-binding domain-containing protein [Myxococcales bacterium]